MKNGVGEELTVAKANTIGRNTASGKRESYVRLNITKLKWKFRE